MLRRRIGMLLTGPWIAARHEPCMATGEASTVWVRFGQLSKGGG